MLTDIDTFIKIDTDGMVHRNLPAIAFALPFDSLTVENIEIGNVAHHTVRIDVKCDAGGDFLPFGAVFEIDHFIGRTDSADDFSFGAFDGEDA